MKTLAVLALTLGMGLAVADDKKSDAPKIAGNYKLISGKKEGEAIGDEAKKGKYTISDKTVTIAGKDGKFVMSYKIDGKNIDMVIDEAPIAEIKGTKAYGIVEVKGDTLKLAYVVMEKEKRPSDFSGKTGFAFELKKEKSKE